MTKKHYINTGLTCEPLRKDKRNRLHCPKCGCGVEFAEYSTTNKPLTFDSGLILEIKDTRWHSWQCNNCGSYDEHGHNDFDFSSQHYNDSAKNCYLAGAK